MESKSKRERDFKVILAIVDRIMEIQAVDRERICWIMDLEYANRDIELDLEQLLNFPIYDFTHDIFGIYENMNRTANPPRLENCFVPRCSRNWIKIVKGSNHGI